MKKLTVLAMVAAVMIAGSAFAVQRHLTPAPNATFAFGVGTAAFGPTTTNNDDSCDIASAAPAATLLLPYFEVDYKSPATTARTTLFTITNVSAYPQIAHVVVWTDWSFPAMDFNIFLTGYDVQAINLYDIIARGVIAPNASTLQPSGTTISEPVPTNPTPGSQPFDSLVAASPNGSSNPNFLAAAVGQCATGLLPGPIPPNLLADLQAVLTTGRATAGAIACTGQVGGVHANAIGYVTIDVAATCSTSLPTQLTYFTGEILFDNVLIGDYQDINPNPATGNYAGGNPMVHIRAIPEGGAAGSVPTPTATNLPFTFYDRYTVGAATRTIDRRQPLPAVWAARYIQGGTGAFNTNFKIWREGFTGTGASCSGSTNVYPFNSAMAITEIVRFDEHENATTVSGSQRISPPPPSLGLPETSSTPTSSGVFPPMSTAAGDVAGWMYLNLNNTGSVSGLSALLSAQRAGFGGVAAPPASGSRGVSQNWVIVSMSAEGRYSVDFDAAWLGNGCSQPVAGGAQIGPVGGVFVCPPGAGCTIVGAVYTNTSTTATATAGSNVTP